MEFLIGTTNPYKIREFAALMSATGCELTPTEPIDPEETEPDFEGNALLKARAYAAHAGGVTICEDSGLIVPALGGLPGAWSARFTEMEDVDVDAGTVGRHVDSGLPREELDARNCRRVLELMEGVEQPHRAAVLSAVLAVALPDGEVLFKSAGETHGWIVDGTEPRGDNGFGYDSVFVGHDTFGKTYGELDSMRKNMRSHRRRVMKEFKTWLGQYLKRERP